jgi:hypothetical protein
MRIPPESWAGYRRTASVRPTCSIAASARDSRAPRRVEPLAAPDAHQFQRQGGVAEHVPPGQQVRVLKHVRDARRAREVHGAAGRSIQSRDHAQQRGLAAAGGAEDGDEFARRDGEVDRLDRDDAAVEGASDGAQLDADRRFDCRNGRAQVVANLSGCAQLSSRGTPRDLGGRESRLFP